MLATAVRIHGHIEGKVRRIVARDHAARTFLDDFGTRARLLFIQQGVLPTVIFGVVPDAFEASFRIGSGAAAFECVGKICHRSIMLPGYLSQCDIQGCLAALICCVSHAPMVARG